MAKANKNEVKVADEDKALKKNMAETVIVADGEAMASEPSRRRAVAEVQDDEVVKLRNKQNGAVNEIPAKYAVRLVNNEVDTYEILK